MQLKPQEFAFLSVSAREEKAADPYALPAHQLQAAHKVPGVTVIRTIKAWARSEGRQDEEIFNLYDSTSASWPWASQQELVDRVTTCSIAPTAAAIARHT
jgi:hypothetical protein